MMDEPGQRAGPDGDGGSPSNGPRRGASGTSAGGYATVGLQFALAIVLSVYAGQWLDRRFGTAPWLMLLTLLFGAGGTFYSIYRKLMADLKRDEEARKR
jgi:F0F1-type ATP synthase assembly protein I